jgi:tetratricopeptide (TPR) repeat protein
VSIAQSLMKNIILVILSILFSLSSLANTNQELMKLGHAAQQRLNEEEALKYYSQAIKDNPQNIEALSQASIMSANIGHRSSSSAVQNKYYNISLNYAQLALNINSNSE